MRTVYLDELFLLNLVINYFLLLASAKICALPYHRVRFALGAALGGLWSCLSLIPGLGFLALPLMRPVLALGMTLAAFGRERKLWRCLGVFLGVSALFGGAVYAAALFRGIPPGGSGPLFRLDMRVLALSFALCWALMSLVFRRAEKNAGRYIYEITAERNGRDVRLRALEDTGNGLYDPLTGRSVLIAEAEAAAPLFSPREAIHLRAPPVEAMGFIDGARLVPWAGIDGRRQLLLAVRPDRLSVDGEPRDDLLIAISPAPLGGDGSFNAIL